MQVSEIYQKAVNAEYYYRRVGKCPLLGLDELQKVIRQGNKIEYDMSYAESDHKTGWIADCLSHVTIRDRLHQLDGLIGIMKKHPGNLFIAGGFVTDMIIMDGGEWARNYESDVDVFIVEESAEKAEELLASIISELGPSVSKLRTTQQVTSFTLGLCEIQIIRRVYSSPDQILMKFDNWACQYLWSPSTGIQMTPMGMAAYMMRAFPEDCSMHSLSVDYRRAKYCNKKGFKVLFPGIPKGAKLTQLSEEFQDLIKPSVRRELFPEEQDVWPPEDSLELPIDDEVVNPWLSDRHRPADLRAAPKKSFQVFRLQDFYSQSDYDGGRSYMNTWNLLEGRLHNICIELHSYSAITQLSEQYFIDQIFGPYAAPEELHNIKLGVAQRLFSTTPHEYRACASHFYYQAWASNFYVYRDLSGASRIWNEMLRMHIKPVIKLFSNPVGMWKVDDPGSQSFGQVHPKPITPREFYGPLYKQTFAGINPVVHALLDRLMCHTYRVPKDVRELIMRYVLKAQAEIDLFGGHLATQVPK